MMAETACPKKIRWIYIHEGIHATACPVCYRLIGTYTVQDENHPPYEIPMHPNCVCSWRIEEIEGLTTDERERLESDLAKAQDDLQSVEGDIKDAEDDIGDYKDDIEDLKDGIVYAEGVARAKRDTANKLRKLARSKEVEAQRIFDDEWDPDPTWTKEERARAEPAWIERQVRAEELMVEASDLRSDADALEDEAPEYDRLALERQRELNNLQRKLEGREDDLAAYKERKAEYEEEIEAIEGCLREPWLEQLIDWVAGAFRELGWG